MSEYLPEQTSDESPEGWNDQDEDRDADLEREVPPHHGE
jgi:hypothetical protein